MKYAQLRLADMSRRLCLSAPRKAGFKMHDELSVMRPIAAKFLEKSAGSIPATRQFASFVSDSGEGICWESMFCHQHRTELSITTG